MTLDEVAAACEGEIVVGDGAAQTITAAYASDLLSDVMGHAPEDSVLITVQNHVNTIAVCTLAEIRAVLICHGRAIPDEMVAVARREGIALLRTPLDQFHASCRLAALA
jgi:predicted transcriptional regulator